MFLFNVAPVFVERKVCYSALSTFLVGWYAGAVSLPPGDVILAQLACHPECHHFLFTSGLTNQSLYKHCATHIRKSRKETKLQFLSKALSFLSVKGPPKMPDSTQNPQPCRPFSGRNENACQNKPELGSFP
jgi:hypothetical protein